MIIFNQEFVLEVENGYGSGEFSSGDTVHIWSNATHGFTVFTNWTDLNNVLHDNDEWHTTFVMPSEDVSITGNYTLLDNISLNYEQIQCVNSIKNVYYAIPENHIGVIFLFHGTGGHGSAWFTKIENINFTKDALERNFIVIATDSEETTLGDLNNDGYLRWLTLPPNVNNNIDIGNVSALIDTFKNRNVINNSDPIFALGMSNGSNFSPSVSYALDFNGTAAYCSKGIPELYEVSNIPTIFLIAENDNVSDNAITIENYNLLVQREINTDLYRNISKPLYPERFMRIDDIDYNTSISIFYEIDSAGFLTDDMLVLGFDNLLQIMLSNESMFPVYNNLSINLQYGINGQLKNTLAEHAFFSDYNNNVLDFFISNSFIVGDVNNDDYVDILDIVIIVNFILNNEYNSSADLNSDAVIDVLDIVLLVNIILN